MQDISLMMASIQRCCRSREKRRILEAKLMDSVLQIGISSQETNHCFHELLLHASHSICQRTEFVYLVLLLNKTLEQEDPVCSTQHQESEM